MESDEALYASLCGGNVEAFDVLYRRYAGRLLGFIRKRLGEGSQAEDTLQEVFLSIARAPNPTVVSVRAWLYQIALNLCLKQLRARKREVEVPDELPNQTEGAEGVLVLESSHATLRAAVARLPQDLSVLYTLRTEGLSYEDMAARLSLPLGTVKSRMHQMVHILREEVSK